MNSTLRMFSHSGSRHRWWSSHPRAISIVCSRQQTWSSASDTATQQLPNPLPWTVFSSERRLHRSVSAQMCCCRTYARVTSSFFPFSPGTQAFAGTCSLDCTNAYAPQSLPPSSFESSFDLCRNQSHFQNLPRLQTSYYSPGTLP